MARLGRTTPIYRAYTDWQHIGQVSLQGPQPPVPVVTTIKTQLVAVATARSSMQRRFPFQGWSGDGLGGDVTFRSAALAAGPAGYWRLGESPGATTAVDELGAHNATYQNSPTLGVPGLLTGDANTAMRTTGNKSAKIATTAFLRGQTKATFTCWVSGMSAASGGGLYVEKGTNDVWQVYANAGTGSLIFSRIDDAGSGGAFVVSGSSVADGGRHHIAVVYDATVPDVAGYIDGAFSGHNSPGVGAQTETVDTYIGNDNNGTFPAGIIDEVAVYQRALSASEIANLYQQGVTEHFAAPLVKRNLGPFPPRVLLLAPELKVQTIRTQLVAVSDRVNSMRQRKPSAFAPTFTQRTGEGYTARNLVTNGGYETNITGTSWFGTGNPPASRTRDTSRFWEGVASLLVVSPGNTSEGPKVATSAAVVRNFTYTASLYVYPEVTGNFRLLAENANTFVNFTNVPAGTWTRLSLTFTTTTSSAVENIVLFSSSGINPTTYSVDGVQLELGQTASPYISTDGAAASASYQPVDGGKVWGHEGRGLRPPTVVIGLPSLQAQETIKAQLVAWRTRVEVQRRAPHSALRPPTVVTQASTTSPIVVSLTAVRSRKPLSALRAPATLEPYAVELDEQTVKASLVQTRPRRTLARLAPPATLEAASTQLQERTVLVKLARIRPPRTRAKVAPPATLEPYSVALEERTIKSALAQTRPRPTTAYLSPPATLEPESVQLEEETIKVSLARIRPVPTTRVLRTPATLEPASVALAERTIRTRLARIRPKPKTARLQPPTTLQVFSGPVVHLVQMRPRPVRSRLAPPTALKTFSGFPPTTVVTRPRKTISGFTRTPLTIPAVTAIRTLIARARPQPTVAFVAPPATLEPESLQDRERRITNLLARTRPRPTTTNLAPPATLEPFSVEQRERTITVWLTRLFRRPTHARLAPPIFYAATSAIRVALGGRTRVEAARRAPHYKLRPPIAVLVPSVEQREETVLVVLAEFVRRLVRPRLRPPTVTAPAETKIRVRLAPARRPKPGSRLAPPTIVDERAAPPIIRTIVKFVAVPERGARVRRGPTSHLFPPGPPRIKGVACLIDLPANLACLVDQLAADACLTDQLAAEGCLSDGVGAQGCLTDKGAACAILSEE